MTGYRDLLILKLLKESERWYEGKIPTPLSVRPLTQFPISPTYRYFLRSKDSCVFLAYLQFWPNTDYLNVSPPSEPLIIID
jgi:hypothetical protein